MSNARKLEKALKRADYRDKKRRTKMKVSGKSVFKLAKLIDQPKPKR